MTSLEQVKLAKRGDQALIEAARRLAQLGRYKSAHDLLRYSFERGAQVEELARLHALPDCDFARVAAPLALKKFGAASVAGWLGPLSPVDAIQANDFLDAEFLIWADINLNVVDGSSAWMVSMARILGRIGKVIVLSKCDIARPQVVMPLLNDANIMILQPRDFTEEGKILTIESAKTLIEEIDNYCPRLRGLFVRGVASVVALTADRRFQHRLFPYLTDVYDHVDAKILAKDGIAAKIDPALRQCRMALFQTEQLRDFVKTIVGFDPGGFILYPPIGDELFAEFPAAEGAKAVSDDETIKIGYAGKIAPNWGIDELLDWTERLVASGIQIELHFFGDKISTGGSAAESQRYRVAMNKRLDRPYIRRYGALSREEVVRSMSEMDFSWCWRPESFEAATLELSSKLVEGAATGQRCIVWPSKINRDFLGEDYPFYLRLEAELQDIVKKRGVGLSMDLKLRVRAQCGIPGQADRLADALGTPGYAGKTVCILTHDAKFILPWYSWLKSQGVPVLLDMGWDWGEPKHPGNTARMVSKADVVFCEWGLANAVWASENIPEGKSLVVRIHAQEVRPRAAGLTKRIKADRVTRFISVSDWVRQKAIEQRDWPAERFEWIPNYLQDEEYRYRAPREKKNIVLGMVGIIPQAKRVDRALDLLAGLVSSGHNAELHLKGHRPSDLSWMHGASRKAELDWFEHQFSRIESDPYLRGRVQFIPWGNDVARFYENVDVILSPSDTESFHYALADGVLAGCFPVVWDWPQSDSVYDSEWIVGSAEAAVRRVHSFAQATRSERANITRSNRDMLCSRYAKDVIYSKLLDAAVLSA